MNEYPILFKPEMISKIIDKSKTQTRRVVKLKNRAGYETVTDDGIEVVPWTASRIEKYVRCPYGKKGDLLWPRHIFYELGRGTSNYQIWDEFTKTVRFPSGREAMDIQLQDLADWRKMPPIFLPKWAARIWLENKGREAMRLQDITDADAKTEGLELLHRPNGTIQYLAPETNYPEYRPPYWEIDPKDAFMWLWDSINGKRGYPWDDNDWVWAITFELKSTNGRPA